MTVNRDYCRPRAAPRSARFGGRRVVFFGVVVAVVTACFLHERGAAVSAAGKAAVAAAPVRTPAPVQATTDVIEPVVNQKDFAFYDRLQQSNVVAPPAELIEADARARAAARERRNAAPAASGRYPTRADAERRGASLSETL